MEGINFGASRYKKAKQPFEFGLAFVLKWSAETIANLGKLNLPFEPYMVNAGRFYVISADNLEPKLLAIADVVLDVINKSVIHNTTQLFEGIIPTDLTYRDVYMTLVREGITHIPPDIQAATELVEHLAMIEQGFVETLRDLGITRPQTTVSYGNDMTTLWDSSNTLRKNIHILEALVKQCRERSDDEKGFIITENFINIANLLPVGTSQKAAQRKIT